MRRADPFDPTGWFTPGKVPESADERRRKRIAINVSFLWLLFPLLDMAHADPGPLRIALVVAATVTFIVVYNWLPQGRPPQAPLRTVAATLAVLTGVAWTLTLADRQSWSLLFVFVAISGAMRLPVRPAWGWLLLCTAFTAASNVLAGANAGSTISLTATTLAIGFMMFAFRRLMELNADLREAREELADHAVSEERLRFARDLHDLLGHSLSVIALKSELAERLAARDPQRAAEHVTEIKDVAREALTEVRQAVSGYRQPTLVGELAGAQMALRAAGIEADLEGTDVELPPDVEALFAWTVREGTTNVIRHSGARSCRIAVEPGLATASAEVVDDGAADATPGDEPAEPAPEGNGLAGLRERAELLAGRVEAGPDAGGGFRLLVTVPLRRPAT
jgi:two-component system sensor histidine kinase DesK